MYACSTPTDRINDFSRRQGNERVVEQGGQFRHVVLRNARPLSEGSLHVYLEGDGSPFLNPAMISPDPTSHNFLMLRLMSLDPVQSVYVGRPCYQEVRTDANCDARYWTSRRFSPEVVASLAAVIRMETARAGARSVQLFGHSGGAALAILLTRELAAVTDIVTIGGNLDTAAWTRLHDYSSLEGSLNPVDVVLPPPLAQHTQHLIGDADTAVTVGIVRQAAGSIGGTVREFPGFTHQCCWESVWPGILQQQLRN